MSGWLKVVGLGPGDPDWLTPQAQRALDHATDIVGYAPYVDRVRQHPSRLQVRHASDNRVERKRAEHALRLAVNGARVAVVSSGDPGIFAMASAVVEAIEEGDAAWRDIEIEIVPGLSAMQSVSARIGAPLGHDFCVISLSDILKPWSVIKKRLNAAFEADFVVSLYNPASSKRPEQIGLAFSIARRHRELQTPVILARAVGSQDERIIVTTIGDADTALIDMRTLVMIGSSQTRLVARPGQSSLVYTPRRYTAR